MPRKNYLYAISDGEAVKLGSSCRVAKRLKTLQTSHHKKLVCLASIQMEERYESLVHKALFYQRIRGEWYRLAPEVLAVIDLYIAGNAAALIAHLEQRFEAMVSSVGALDVVRTQLSL